MAENLIYATKENLKRVSDNMKVYVDSDKTVSIKGYLKINNTWNFYNTTTPTEETAPIFSIDIPAEYFLDQTKTSFVQEFVWSDDLYTGSVNPNLDGKPVLVMAVKGDDNTATYSFVNVERLIDIYTGENTKSISLTVGEDNKITANVNISEAEGNILAVKDDGMYATVEGIFKTYKSLDELGLTAPVKVKDIVSAMEIGTEAYIDCTDGSLVITDLPENGTMPCEVYIRKHFGGMIHVEAILANTRYLGDDGGTAYTWEKVATTNWVSSLVNNPYEYVYDTTIYGDDILKYTLGHYKVGNNATIGEFTNLPVNTPGMLDVMCPTSGGNQSPWESQYGYRYYRYTTYRGGTYERTLASGATAGNITEDTGWVKVINSDDVIPVENGGTGASDVTNARKNLGLKEAAMYDITDSYEATPNKVATGYAIYDAIDGGFTKRFTYEVDLSNAEGYIWLPLITYQTTNGDEPINFRLSVLSNAESEFGGSTFNGFIDNNTGTMYGYGYNSMSYGGTILKGMDIVSKLDESLNSTYTLYIKIYIHSKGQAEYANIVMEVLPTQYIEVEKITSVIPVPDADFTGSGWFRFKNVHWNGLYTDNFMTGTINSESTELYLGEYDYISCYVNKDGLMPDGDGGFDLGASNKKWRNIYASNGTIQTSDRTQKTDIVELDGDKAKNFIMGLNPSTYKMVNGTSDRTHWGLISQDVEQLLENMGLSSTDFAGFIKTPKVIAETIVDEKNKKRHIEYTEVEGEHEYSLRYDEFISPMVKTIQVQQQEINELRDIVEELRNKIQ